MSIYPTLTAAQEEEIYGTSDITVLNIDNERCQQPDGVNISLKLHQLALIKYCQRLEDSSRNPIIHKEVRPNKGEYVYEISSKLGIIGDIVGSGKTLSVLGLISSTKNEPLNINTYNTNAQCAKNVMIKCIKKPIVEVKELNTTLIVVPHPIFKQWETTIKTQTSLSYTSINNSKSLKKFLETIFRSILKEEYKNEFIETKNTHYYNTLSSWDGESINNTDIVLVSSTFYNKLIPMFMTDKFKFKRIVFDEADSIKISGKSLPSYSFIWFVTSTFSTLLNPNGVRIWYNSNGESSRHYNYSNGFINSMRLNGITSRGFIKDQMLLFESHKSFRYKHYFIVKNDNEFVREAFNLEVPIINVINCKQPLSLRVLSTSASNEILAFINAGDIQGAVESLDCDKVSEEGLIAAVTKDFKIKLRNNMIEYEAKSKMVFSSESIKNEILYKLKEKIDELNKKIENIQNKLNDSLYCSICFDCDIVCPTIVPCCNTKFCFECITKWLTIDGHNKGCPHCRSKISPNSLIIVNNDAAASCKKCNDDKLDKIDNLEYILTSRRSENPNMKVLIFSEYQRTFENIAKVLTKQEFKYSRIAGTTATINNLVTKYKSNTPDAINCLLLNAEFCASGLNLENTTDIIIMHKMSTEKMTQIIGRGQRPGRTSTLRVWKLFYDTEM